jgi:hypothetical protein
MAYCDWPTYVASFSDIAPTGTRRPSTLEGRDMMLQMSAIPTSPAIRTEPAPKRSPGNPACPKPAWFNEDLRRYMAVGKSNPWELATHEVVDALSDGQTTFLKRGDTVALAHAMVAAGSSDVVIEATANGCVVTGVRGKTNECRLIFRHAYSRVLCDVHVPNGSADSRITYLRSPAFEEMHSFTMGQPSQRHRGGSGGYGMTLEYHAEPLNEVQGILWRGGLLQISRIRLIP